MEQAEQAESAPPKFVFIVPYRDREPHRVFFDTYIHKIMADIPPQDWAYYFIHQKDKRPFNRGAMKNIGFLALKDKYPNDYKNIVFIFNDVDTLPYDKNILHYHTEFGVVKHFYGFHFALGGIFSIRGVDFERINGFPNYWAWGGEDNVIQQRAKEFGLVIDRSNFFTIGNQTILQFADGMKRLICRDELATSIIPNNKDGINTIAQLTYDVYTDTHMVDVNTFRTYISPEQLLFEEQTLDKLNKIRVSPLKAVQNIRELKGQYDITQTKHIYPVEDHNKHPSHHPSHPSHHPSRVFSGMNYANQTIQPQLPFMINPLASAGSSMMRGQPLGMMIPQENRPRTAASAQTTTPTPAPTQVNPARVFQNQKQNSDIMMSLNKRPSTNNGIQNHRMLGMKGLFM